MAIKLVIFDIGGVLIDFMESQYIDYLHRNFMPDVPTVELEEFEEGTMRPKVEACIDFVGGKKERIAKVRNLFKVKEKQGKDFGTTIVA